MVVIIEFGYFMYKKLFLKLNKHIFTPASRYPEDWKPAYVALQLGFIAGGFGLLGRDFLIIRTVNEWYPVILSEIFFGFFVGIAFLLHTFGWAHRAIILSCVAGVCSATSFTIMLGWAGCFHLWYINLAVLLLAVPIKLVLKCSLAVFIIVIYCFMFLTFSGTQPSIEISEWVQNILGLSNIIGSLLILGLPMAMYSFFLVQEREKSERLLLNIMPKEIADKLKQNDNLIAIENQSMSVLMADIVSFTKLANSISAEKLVDFLNKMFSDFDEVVEKFGVEKIKTVGDAYMVVSGLPRERNDHAQVLINVAQRFLEIAAEYEDHEGNPIELRIGINSGPAVSGVIGKSKFAFDVWGDTINTAARLESYGMPGKLHLSETTFNSLKEKPDVPIVREIEMKGKGLMKTYLI